MRWMKETQEISSIFYGIISMLQNLPFVQQVAKNKWLFFLSSFSGVLKPLKASKTKGRCSINWTKWLILSSRKTTKNYQRFE